MFRTRDKNKEIRELQDQIDFTTDQLNPNHTHIKIKDGVLADIVVRQEVGIDIRTIDEGCLLWYNEAYLNMLFDFEQTLEQVKDWESINNITEISHFDSKLKDRGKGHGLMHKINNFRNHKYMNNFQMFKSMRTHERIQTLETYNVPQVSSGKKLPMRMVNTVLWHEDLVITEFHLLYKVLEKTPQAILRHYLK
jgi:hypothetical protein|tara:strand:+ start:195 stop:776 length:582 start_codon:yes stop_codon:yes gene_type:complete